MAGKSFTIEAVFKAADQMTAPLARMQKGVAGFCKNSEKQFKQLNKAADAWFSGMKTGAIAIAGGVTAAGAALAVAAKPGLDFEQAIANVGAVSLMTRDQVADLEKEARRLGKSTKFSATEVAGGMELMGKAGFTNTQIIAGIGGMLDAAAAEGAGFEEVASTISNTLNGMGLERTTKNVEEVADVLTLASARTNSSILSLGESMKNVAPVAKQFKVPFKTAVTAVALLQDVGIDASEAGTATATMLTQLAKPTDDILKKMKKLGISFQDSKGDMLPMEQVLQNFGKAASKAGGNMEAAAFFTDLVGMRGQRAALNLQEAFKSGKFTELSDALDDAHGKAKEMAKLRMDTVSGEFTRLWHTVEDIGISLFDLKDGPLKTFIEDTRKWVEENSGAIVQGISDFVGAISKHWADIEKWGERILKVVAVISIALGAVKLWTTAIGLLGAALEGLALMAVTNPIGLLIAALVAALALIVAFWPEIAAFFTNIWDLCVETFEPIKQFFVAWFEFVVGLWTLAAEQTRFIWEPIGEFFGWLWSGIAAVASASFEVIATVAKTYFDIVSTVWGALIGVFSTIWDAISSTFWAVMGPVFKAIGGVIDFVRGAGQETLGTGPTSSASAAAETIGPHDRAADRFAESFSETSNVSTAELLIRDTTGKAKMSKKPTGPGISLRVQPTGAFF